MPGEGASTSSCFSRSRFGLHSCLLTSSADDPDDVSYPRNPDKQRERTPAHDLLVDHYDHTSPGSSGMWLELISRLQNLNRIFEGREEFTGSDLNLYSPNTLAVSLFGNEPVYGYDFYRPWDSDAEVGITNLKCIKGSHY